MQEIDKSSLIKKVLADKGPLRFKDIVKETGLSEPTVAKWLKRLKEQGEVRKTLLPNKDGVFYELVDKKYFIEEIICGELILYILNSTLRRLKEDPNLGFTDVFPRYLGEAILWIGCKYKNDFKKALRLSTFIVGFTHENISKAIVPSEEPSNFERYMNKRLNELKNKRPEELRKEIEKINKKIEDVFKEMKLLEEKQ